MVSKGYSLTHEVFSMLHASSVVAKGAEVARGPAGMSRPRFPSLNRKNSSD